MTKTHVDGGALLPGEAEVLRPVIDDLPNVEAKLAYADWLQKNNETRGSLFQQFFHSANESEPLPDSSRFSKAWRDIVGITLEEELRRVDLSDLRKDVLRLAAPEVGISIGRRRQFPTGRSRFGGLPDLPAHTSWPQWDLRALGFLAQINLEDLRETQASWRLPKSRLLSFFVYNDYEEGLYHFQFRSPNEQRFGGDYGRRSSQATTI